MLHFISRLLLLLLSIFLISGCSPLFQTGQWSQFHGDVANRGVNLVNTPYTLRPQWIAEVGSIVHSAPAISEDGVIYIGNMEGQLVAVNTDGTIKWRTSFPNESIPSSPAVGGDGNIYVISSREIANKRFNSTLHSVAPNGNVRWSHTFANEGATTASPKTLGEGANVRIFINVYLRRVSGQGRLFIFNQAGTIIKEENISKCQRDVTGSTGGAFDIFGDIWEIIRRFPIEFDASFPPLYQIFGWPDPTIAIENLPNQSSVIVVVDKFCEALEGFRWVEPNLTLLWKQENKAFVESSSPALLLGDSVIIGRRDGRVLAYGIRSGTKRWEYNAKQAVTATPALVLRPIYIASLKKLHVLDIDGKLLNEFDFPFSPVTQGSCIASPALSSDLLYVSDLGGMYSFAFDLSNYAVDTSVEGGISSPAIGNNGTVYVADLNGKLRAYSQLSFRSRTTILSTESSTEPTAKDSAIPSAEPETESISDDFTS